MPPLLVTHLQFLQTHLARQERQKSYQANAQRQGKLDR